MEGKDSRTGPLKFECPKCGAKIGQVCSTINYRGTRAGVRPHRERFNLYKESVKE